MKKVPYASAIGSLMYAMICTRPNIAHAIGIVSRFLSNPRKEHWNAVKWIMRYLCSTSSLSFCFGTEKPILCCYTDSDMAGDVDTRKSTSGYLITYAGGAVSWQSRLQKCVALSTTKAELIATVETCKELLYMKRFMEELGFAQVRDVLDSKLLELEKIHTDDNGSDILTKALPRRKFEECCGASSEKTPLQRTRRSGHAPAAEADQRIEPVPETEAPMDAGPMPGDETAATSESVVLVNEAFIRVQQEVDDLKGQLHAQGRETEKFQHLLQVKEDQLNRAAALSNLQPELEAAKAENLRLKDELAGMVEKNRLLEADKVGLSQDNARFYSRLGELEATISQLRGELDSVKTDAVNMAERHRRLESENAKYKDKLRVFEQKAEDRARICDELKTKFEETAEANEFLKAELESATQVQRILDVERSELVDKLAQAEVYLIKALKNVEAAEAHTTITVEYERWKSWRATLEQAQQGFGDLLALILEPKKTEEEAKRALDTDSEDSEQTVSERSGSSCTG
ncbi:uncharacterized protein LOC132639459 [Lycium barbarum]|uniref:uncharacterized protein LOC132639459 n=1 Tax=Lycium barbarum TaxID=112863 RepID=UPI00293ED88D|nr:uncharacterized protein LOC132639459 [Lycium barbarum]